MRDAQYSKGYEDLLKQGNYSRNRDLHHVNLFFLFMGWRIIYIEEAMNVRLYLDNIKIEKESTEITIPLIDIHSLIIDNQKVTMTIPLISKCAEYNINLVICSLEHMPQALIQPYNGNYQSPLMLKKQIAWDEGIKKILHQLIIKNKISNQIDLLKHLNLDINVIQKLFQFSTEVLEGDSLNREGLAAKMYFRTLYGKNFKRFDEDVINYGLNYGYAILRSQISKTLIAKGLTPCLGIIHIGYNNPFNLADDIIEVFRSLIDWYAYRNLKDAIIFKKEHRLELIKLTTLEVMIQGKKQTLLNAISIFVDRIIDIFETGDFSKFEEVHLIYGV